MKPTIFHLFRTPLLRNILLISLVAAIFFPSFSFTVISPRFLQQLNKGMEDTARRLAKHLEETVAPHGTILESKDFTSEVRTQIELLLKDMGLEEIKIFSKEGRVVYCSDPEEKGTTNTHEYFRNTVAKGRIYTKQVAKGSKTLEGRTVGRDVLEIYVPVMAGNQFSGAIELYYDITENRSAMSKLVFYLKIIMTAFSSLVVVIVVIILSKASLHMRNREDAETALKAAHDLLEQQVTQRTFELKIANQALLEEIEKHRLSAQALRDSEKRLTAILEANPDPMIMVDTQDRPKYLNPAFTALFGWTIEELQESLLPFVPDSRKKLDAVKFKVIYQGRHTSSFETVRRTREGKLLDVLISAAVTTDETDKPSGMVQNLTDITVRKRMEIQLRQAQRMESIGTLAGGIAHDFNNILSGIYGYTQLAKINISTPEKALSDIDQVQKASQRATELVRQILTFSRQSEYSRQDFKLAPLVKEVLKLIRSSIPSTISIREMIESEGKIFADHSQIHQVLMNLCTNAFQAMQKGGGTLTVSLRNLKIKESEILHEEEIKTGDYLCLGIKDTGHGMDERVLEKIFDPYFTTKAQGEGTGLGLAVVHGIIKEHGGYIHVTSSPGQGSTFLVYLPESHKHHQPMSKTSITDENDFVGNESIMLVDDEEHIRSSVKDYFIDRGYDIHVFSEGSSALEAFCQNPDRFDCLITDLTMPGLTGEELAEEVHGMKPDMPIIFCSGYGDAISAERVQKLGGKKFIPKPYQLKELLKTVREQLSSPK